MEVGKGSSSMSDKAGRKMATDGGSRWRESNPNNQKERSLLFLELKKLPIRNFGQTQKLESIMISQFWLRQHAKSQILNSSIHTLKSTDTLMGIRIYVQYRHTTDMPKTVSDTSLDVSNKIKEKYHVIIVFVFLVD